jgi:hypothetical protein
VILPSAVNYYIELLQPPSGDDLHNQPRAHPACAAYCTWNLRSHPATTQRATPDDAVTTVTTWDRSSHLTKQCLRKDKSDNGNHPANYKGCIVYKDLQKRTFPPLQRRQDGKYPHDLPQPITTTASSYATALKSSLTPPSADNTQRTGRSRNHH